MADIFAMTDSWTVGGTTYTAIKMDVTDTASAAGSKLLDLQVGGVSKFLVAKNGVFGGPSESVGFLDSTGAAMRSTVGIIFKVHQTSYDVRMHSLSPFGWTSSDATAAHDLILARDAANVLAQRNGTTAQAFNIYRTWTDASNFQRLSLSWNTSTALLMNQGLGTGADGNIAFNDAALATSATLGYVMIPSCAGAPTGVPADIPTGQVALHFDSTNNKLYVYDAGWISTAALT